MFIDLRNKSEKPKPMLKKREIDQPSITQSFKRLKTPTTSKQANVDEALIEYISKSLKPYSTVEDPNFIKLVKVIDPSIKVMGRKNVIQGIAAHFNKCQEYSRNIFDQAQFVATAADIWSCSRHGYMGVTATVLTQNFERINRAIACKHFKNPHDGERIAEIISNIHDSFGLVYPRLCGTITDNGRNIVRAFNLAGIINEDEATLDDPVNALVEELQDIKVHLPTHQR